jgi:hypothetical protein
MRPCRLVVTVPAPKPFASRWAPLDLTPTQAGPVREGLRYLLHPHSWSSRGGCLRNYLNLFLRFLALPVHYPYEGMEVDSVCVLIDDDAIEELAMGRGQGTKEEAHVPECCECQERIRQSREWITTFRQVFATSLQKEEPKRQKHPVRKSKSFLQPALSFERRG